MLENTPSFWIVFHLFILGAIILDLTIFNAVKKRISLKKSLILTAFWISLALSFNVFIYFQRGLPDALTFLTGYLIEYSLSVDNLFIFVLIFSYFKVPKLLTHTVLFWGILGAIVMRAIFILAGIAIIESLHWMVYVFGIFLVYTGFKLGFSKEMEIEPENNFIIRSFKKIYPVTDQYAGNRFFTKIEGKWFATPLMVVLIAIETIDIIFAIDSIPAILGITLDPVLVYTSNIFAVLGLRSLYFALEGMMQSFHYLSYGLALILVFIGLKMLASAFFQVPILYSLAFIGSVLVISVLASLIKEKRNKKS